MSAVNEYVVREFFELLGYLVNQPRKHSVSGRPKTPDEGLDMMIVNPRVTEHKLPENMVWQVSDFKTVARAVVAVRGWHTERFYVSTFEQTPEILRFAETRSVRFAEEFLGSASVAKILCLPALPAGGELREKTIEILRKNGVDGVISFRTILAELVARVETHRNYEKSDILQVIRLLKNYDFLQDGQLELFRKKRARGKSKA